MSDNKTNNMAEDAQIRLFWSSVLLYTLMCFSPVTWAHGGGSLYSSREEAQAACSGTSNVKKTKSKQ